MSKSLGFLARFWRDELGGSAAEYVLLLAIIAAGLAVAISNLLENQATCIDEGSNCIP